MPEPIWKIIGGNQMGLVPGSYRYLSFDGKLAYTSKWGDTVWSHSLVYSDGSPAAVGPDNQPLPDQLELDTAGNVISFKGYHISELEGFGTQAGGQWELIAEVERGADAIKAEIRSEQAQVDARRKYDTSLHNEAKIKKLNEDKAKLEKAKQTHNKAAIDEATKQVRKDESELGD